MFTNLPTGSVPLYGAKPADVSQFKRKKRTQATNRDKLSQSLAKISSFLSQINPNLLESNKRTNNFIFSLEFILKLSSKVNPADPNPEEPIENNEEIENLSQNQEQPQEEPKQGSLGALDIPEGENPDTQQPQDSEEKKEENVQENNEETNQKDDQAEKPIQENSSNSNPVQNEIQTQDTHPEHIRSDSYQSFDNQSAPTRVNDYNPNGIDVEDHVETGKGSLVSSSQAIDEPNHQEKLQSTTQDYIYTQEKEYLDMDLNAYSQGNIVIQDTRSLQQTSYRHQNDIPSAHSQKTRTLKSEEELPARKDSNLSGERKKLQKILDPIPHEIEPIKKVSEVNSDSTEGNRRYFPSEYTPQGIYKDEFRKMMKQKANYDVTSSFFPIKTDIKVIPKRPQIESKKSMETSSSASVSGRKVVKKSATTQLKSLDGLPIIFEQNTHVPSLFPDVSKSFEPGRKIQNIQLPAIDTKNLIRVPIKKPPQKNLVSQSVSVNNLALFSSQTPQSGSVRVLNFGDNLQLAKKLYSEKSKPAHSLVLEKGSNLASPLRGELSAGKSPKFARQLGPIDNQLKIEPLKNIKIRKIANPNAVKKSGQ